MKSKEIKIRGEAIDKKSIRNLSDKSITKVKTSDARMVEGTLSRPFQRCSHFRNCKRSLETKLTVKAFKPYMRLAIRTSKNPSPNAWRYSVKKVVSRKKSKRLRAIMTKRTKTMMMRKMKAFRCLLLSIESWLMEEITMGVDCKYEIRLKLMCSKFHRIISRH